MTFQTVPWAVGGGAENPVEAARLLAYVATRSEAGVVLPADCEVRELDVPAGSVRVLTGSLVVPNTKTGASAETYLARNLGEETIAITPTDAGGGRSDLVYVRIADPQYGDEAAPADVATGPYVFLDVIEGVAGTTTSLEDAIAQGLAPAGRVGYALARVDLLASTGTVTQDDITDLRRVANPRQRRQPVTLKFPTGTDDLTNSAYVTWPAVSATAVEVPEWATHATVRIDSVGTVYTADNVSGFHRVSLGTVKGQGVPYNCAAGAGADRRDFVAIDTIAIPEALRGTTQTVALEGRRSSGAGFLRTDAYVTIVVDVEFVEKV